jgi:hypothetical protein
MTRTTLWMATAISISTAVGPAGAAPDGRDTVAASHDTAEQVDVIEQFLQSGTPELKSYVARRLLTASTRGGRMQAWLEAWTYLEPDGAFRFEITCGSGSGMIQKRVLVAALDAERRGRQPRAIAEAAITKENYELQLLTASADGLREIRLTPRRRSQLLVDGSALVGDQTADLVEVRGRLSKTPSWWTRRVDIVRRYARVAGVRVPVEMTSSADVRIVGRSSFAMAYEYAMINGQSLQTAHERSRLAPGAHGEAVRACGERQAR